MKLANAILGAACGLLLIPVLGRESRSNTLAGIAAHAYYPSQQDCLFPQNGWSSITNWCSSSGTVTAVIPFPNTFTTGTRTFQVSRDAVPAGEIGGPRCTVNVVSYNGALSWSSGYIDINATLKTIGSRNTSASDNISFYCDLTSSGSINSVIVQ